MPPPFCHFDESSAYRTLRVALKWQAIKQENPTTQCCRGNCGIHNSSRRFSVNQEPLRANIAF